MTKIPRPNHHLRYPLTYLDTECQQVELFHRRFGFLAQPTPVHLTTEKLQERVDFLSEELSELQEAVDRQDLVKIFDALLDLVYVAKGTAVMLGLPWGAGWREVHLSNLEKVRGATHRGNADDVTKPPGWEAPRLGAVLAYAGYDYDLWHNDRGQFLEARGLDHEYREVPRSYPEPTAPPAAPVKVEEAGS